jgi:hypothetical protein
MRNAFLSLALITATVSPALAQETAVAQEASASTQAPAQVTASRGQVLVAANGARIGRVNRLAADGAPQLIVDGKLVTVPLATLSVVDGRLVSTLTAAEIAGL